MKSLKLLAPISAGILAALLLTACGGGGGSSPASAVVQMPEGVDEEQLEETTDDTVTTTSQPSVEETTDDTVTTISLPSVVETTDDTVTTTSQPNAEAEVPYADLPLYEGFTDGSEDVYFATYSKTAHTNRDLGCTSSSCDSTSHDVTTGSGSSVTVKGSSVSVFKYMAHGMRIWEEATNGTTEYGYDAVAYGEINTDAPDASLGTLTYQGTATAALSMRQSGLTPAFSGTSEIVVSPTSDVSVTLTFAVFNDEFVWTDMSLTDGWFGFQSSADQACSGIADGCDTAADFIEGALFGPNHEEAGGVYRNGNLIGSFGGSRL